MRIAIVGSCVTRDLWEFGIDRAERFDPGVYIARTTVRSLLAKPLPSEVRDWDLDGYVKFDQKRFLWDLDKRHFELLEQDDWDALLIDLIDERFPTYWMGDAALTYTKVSRPLLDPLLEGRGGRLVQPLQEPAMTMEALRRLALRLRGIASGRPVVVHHAKRALKHLQDGEIVPFSRQDRLLEWNAHHERCYGALVETGDFDEVRVADERLLAGGDHRWELSPFHYDRSYYVDIAAQLEQLLG